MRVFIKEFVKLCTDHLPLTEPIYEFGSLQVTGQKGFADIREYFKGREFIGSDIQAGPGVDAVLDLHDINLPAGSVGTAFILDTLEHVEYPRKAIAEVHRVLSDNGILVISSVMKFPIHNYPFDYWRYSPEAFRSLLKPFKNSLVDYAGEKHFPHTVVGIAGKNLDGVLDQEDFTRLLGQWKKKWRNPTGSFWKKWSRLCLPPVLFNLYNKFRGI